MLKWISVLQLSVPHVMVACHADALVNYCKTSWMRMLIFPNAEVTTPILTSSLSNAEVLEAVLAWTVAGLSDEHIVKMFSCQDKTGHKPNAGLKAYSVYLIATSNLCLLLVSEFCD